jgi:CheY-like chemotaxis protein
VRVVSAPGAGATITVYLPATDARPVPVVVPTDDAAGWTHRGTALLVDDEPVVREVVRDMLSDMGLTAVTASEGEDAIALLEGLPSRFDLAILDLHMPGLPSLRVLEALRTIAPGLPVLLTSGYGPSDHVRFALEQHAGTAFLQKPYRLADLRVTLRALLGDQRSA